MVDEVIDEHASKTSASLPMLPFMIGSNNKTHLFHKG